MIKDWIRILGILLLTGMLVAGCTEDDLASLTNVGDKEVRVALPFGSKEHEEIRVTTRGTYELHHESMVRNMYVFLFADGKKVYGRYFDDDDLDQTGNKEYWEVQNMSSDGSTDQTSGTLHICVPAVSGAGAEIVLIANIDLDFMNMSEDRLGLVRSQDELNALMVSLNQELPERNAGFFMMTGSRSGVSIYEDGSITVPGGKVMLERLDAKVEVNVRVNPTEQTNNQRVEDFTPESWQVINLPNSSLLMPSQSGLASSYDVFFNTNPKTFETTENELVNGNPTGGMLYGFSFYTLENLKSDSKKKSVEGNYHNRDRRIKYTDDPEAENYGKYNTEGDMWEYAPEQATYMIIKGELKMLVDPGLTTEQHLVADVTYVVHLGDFASDKDNYDIVRNTHYKYTINIKGVDNIEVEVETSNDGTDGVTENQSGAMGNVYSVEEEVYTFDAHYGQRVYTFPASSINIDAMTWYVKTPFGREGIPVKDPLTGQDIYNDLDYKWVEFCVNDMQADGTYSSRNMAYPGIGHESLMDVVEFMAFLKAEKIKYEANQDNAFDKDGNLRVTIFVNEFYYEVDPMNPNNKPQDLWKRFVNQPNRLMHILCESAFSKDGDSSITGSIVTIRQRSIQTPYNLKNADLMTAWGCETIDEKTSNYGFYDKSESVTYAPSSFEFLYNDSPDNGLYNTLGLWGLNMGGTMAEGVRWETYLDYDRENDHNLIWMKDNYAVMRWSTMMRNRDNNGNGIIDPDEIRWYQAATNQLLGLYIGELGVSNDSRLYNTAYAVPGSTDGYRTFRRHVLSSTKCSENNSVLDFWAEQGIVTTRYRVDYYDNYGEPFRPHLSVRCVRNLGMDNPTKENILKKEENLPHPLVVVNCMEGEGTANAVYSFDLRNVNEESLRYYTTKELLPTNEFSTSARTYRGFVTGGLTPIRQTTGTVAAFNEYNNLKNQLDNNESPVAQETYRVPNIREAALMTLYIKNDNWWGNDATMVSTYTALGQTSVGGLGLENGNSWCFGGNNYIVQNENVHGAKRIIIRYVKDWEPE